MPAVMYPRILTEEIRSDRKRRAELKVYNALKRTLTDDFHVFYNCNWLDLHWQRNREDGEADFVVAHKKFGYIVLEVKGGEISMDENGQWRSKGEGNEVYEIRDPVKQAEDSKHVIFRKLKENLGNNLGSIRKRHAVVFPGSSCHGQQSDFRANMPREIFMFLEDMPNLGSKIKALLNDTRQCAPLGKAGIDGLIKLFSSRINFELSLLEEIKSCEFEIEELTQGQKKILKQIESNQRVLISGGAGTGKTSLAIEKAKLLAKSEYSVLFLCFNIPLREYLNHILSGLENIHVYAYHQLCLEVAEKANIPLPDKTSDENKYWEEVAYVFLDALEKNPDMRYDAIIVDEGQDFKDEWLESLEYCLRDRDNGFFYIFYDDNQRIYHQHINGLKNITSTHFNLIENIRNSKPIFSGSNAFYQGKTLESLGPDGLDIEWIEADQQRDRELEKILNILTKTKRIPKSEIAVLTARSYKEYKNFSVGKYEFCRANNINSDYIVLDSIRRFKGLEKKVIILIDLNAPLNDGQLQLLYVGFSRARSLLFVVDDTETIKDLKSKILCKNNAR